MPKEKSPQPSSSKKKGDILELIVEELCTGYDDAKVSRNVKLLGKTGVGRQVDVLINATLKSFDIKIIVEAKNYKEKVGIEIVEAFQSKLFDVGGSVGVIVCPLGFTEGAIKSAALADIQLFQAFDHKLGNTTQFIPLRYISPDLEQFQLRIASGAMNSRVELPSRVSDLRFEVKDRLLNLKDLAMFAWNAYMVPQEAGDHIADFGVLKVSASQDPRRFYYVEVKLSIRASETYYLKLFPASYMKNISSNKGNHQLKIDVYSKEEDMLKNGWRVFPTREAMEAEASIYDTSPDVRGLIFRPQFTYEEASR